MLFRSAAAQQTAPAARPSVTRPTEADGRADFVPPEPSVDARYIQHPASDYMVDVFKALDFDYVAVNPGSAFEGIHESLINHGGNRKPEILTVLHEEAGAAMAHGYAKAAGKQHRSIFDDADTHADEAVAVHCLLDDWHQLRCDRADQLLVLYLTHG